MLHKYNHAKTSFFMQISIIIPTLNEVENIGKLIRYLKRHANNALLEIIVVDGQSRDNTEGVARQAGATVFTSEKQGRAVQMNLGAKAAKGNIFYFIHADCFPPKTYCADIQQFIQEDFDMGCYRYRFNSSSFLLEINAYFTRFSPLWCRGGDETLFVKRSVFEELKGYDEYFSIMEEYDFIRRAKAHFKMKIMPKYALVSARKYEKNGYFRVQWANLKVFRLFKKGVSPDIMVETYRGLLDYR
jgi:rSAM/selenodomain-associated transferase 2